GCGEIDQALAILGDAPTGFADPRSRARVALVPHLAAQGRRGDARRILTQVDGLDRLEATCALSAQLTGQEQAELLAEAGAAAKQVNRSFAGRAHYLVARAHHDAGDRETALALARGITDPTWRSTMLAEAVAAAPEPEQGRLYKEARAAALEIDAPLYAASALV